MKWENWENCNICIPEFHFNRVSQFINKNPLLVIFPIFFNYQKHNGGSIEMNQVVARVRDRLPPVHNDTINEIIIDLLVLFLFHFDFMFVCKYKENENRICPEFQFEKVLKWISFSFILCFHVIIPFHSIFIRVIQSIDQ